MRGYRGALRGLPVEGEGSHTVRPRGRLSPPHRFGKSTIFPGTSYAAFETLGEPVIRSAKLSGNEHPGLDARKKRVVQDLESAPPWCRPSVAIHAMRWFRYAYSAS